MYATLQRFVADCTLWLAWLLLFIMQLF